MSLTEMILRKEWLRSDAFWARTPLYQSSLKRIPTALDAHALLESQYWPRPTLERLQDARARVLARRAAKLPFWSAIFERYQLDKEAAICSSLAGLPLMTKDHLAMQPVGAYANLDMNSCWQDHTSGSTGRPFRFFHDRHYELRSLSICDRMFRTAGGGTRFPVISMRPRWRPGVLTANDYYFFVRGLNSVERRFAALQELAARYPHGVILQGFTSVLSEFTSIAERCGNKLRVRGIIATGEHLSEPQRHRMECVLHAPVYRAYTTRELGWLGFECEAHRLHINEEWAFVEIVDAAGNKLLDGTEGSIAVTTFDNRVMPFIRYLTGDIGSISNEPCSCGRTLKTMSLHGRAAQRIDLGEGLSTSLLEVAGTFDRFFNAVHHYQIVQRASRTFTMRIVAGPTFTVEKNDLHAALLRSLHPTAQIAWDLVDAIPETSGGKAAYYIIEAS